MRQERDRQHKAVASGMSRLRRWEDRMNCDEMRNLVRLTPRQPLIKSSAAFPGRGRSRPGGGCPERRPPSPQAGATIIVGLYGTGPRVGHEEPLVG